MNKFFIFFYAVSIALLYTTSTVAAGTNDAKAKKIYDIEIIIFKNKSVPKGNELNLPTPSPAHNKHTLDLSNTKSLKKANRKGFSNLAKSELRLLSKAKRIKKSSRYDLLLHTGWRQPGLAKKRALSVRIKGGKTFGRGYSSIDQSESQIVAQPSATTATVNKQKALRSSELTGVLYELEGQITISLSRYLHTQANLVLRKPSSSHHTSEGSLKQQANGGIETTEGQRLLNFGLNEKRRMRSKKLHYLDHPQFGMLVLITPYEQPEG